MHCLRDFQHVGKNLFIQNCNNSHSGNISIRLGNRIIITRSGAQLGSLTREDLTEVSFYQTDDKNASREIPVHRGIYQENPKINAIVHAHCPYTISLSEYESSLIPFDAEGLFYFPEVPVIKVKNPIGSKETGEEIASLFRKYQAVILKSHGIFAVGDSLEQAYQTVSSIEHSAKMSVYKNILDKYYRLP